MLIMFISDSFPYLDQSAANNTQICCLRLIDMAYHTQAGTAILTSYFEPRRNSPAVRIEPI